VSKSGAARIRFFVPEAGFSAYCCLVSGKNSKVLKIRMLGVSLRGGKYSGPLVPENFLCWQKEKREGRKMGKERKEGKKEKKEKERKKKEGKKKNRKKE
jgi:hypothetical protein